MCRRQPLQPCLDLPSSHEPPSLHRYTGPGFALFLPTYDLLKRLYVARLES